MEIKGSVRAVVAALIGNAAITVSKVFAAIFTGSSAMLSEAIHSLVDTINQGLILYGIKRAVKPADKNHPFGYGMELYFWSFIVAILIFALGAGVSVFEGLNKVINPEVVTSTYVNYIVLGAAFVFESIAWLIAYKEFKLRKGSQGHFECIRNSKDPALFTVLIEDSAAILGLAIAFIGIILSDFFAMPELDGIASIMIGVLLIFIACILAIECKGLLIGESADVNTINGIRSIVESYAGIEIINELLTMHMSPRDILVTLSVDFSPNLSSNNVEALISKIERDIKTSYPYIKRIFLEAQSRRDHIRDAEKTTL